MSRHRSVDHISRVRPCDHDAHRAVFRCSTWNGDDQPGRNSGDPDRHPNRRHLRRQPCDEPGQRPDARIHQRSRRQRHSHSEFVSPRRRASAVSLVSRRRSGRSGHQLRVVERQGHEQRRCWLVDVSQFQRHAGSVHGSLPRCAAHRAASSSTRPIPIPSIPRRRFATCCRAPHAWTLRFMTRADAW